VALLELVTLGVFVAAIKKRSAAPADREGWSGGQSLGQLDLIDIDGAGHLMQRDAGLAFTAMREQAQLDGVTLHVDSAFRTMAEQQALYDLYKAGKGNLAAAPGYSNHQAGLAVDVDSQKGTNAAYDWLVANAHVFGFYRTVPSEAWHWEYRA